MNRKKIAIATLYTSTAEFHCNQVKQLFTEFICVEKYCFDDRSIERGITADLVLIPSYSIFEAVKKYIKNNSKIIVANRTLSKTGLNKIKDLPKNTKSMLVNVTDEMTMETISLIYQLGVDHIELVPVYSGLEEVPNISIAITPRESKYVPDFVNEIIDIGDRVLDISTIMDIAVNFDLEHILHRQNIREYFNQIVPLNFGLEKMLTKTNRLENQFDSLLTILDEGIIGVNSKGLIYSYNESASKIIGFKKEKVIGNYADEILPQIPFEGVFKTLKPVKEKLIKINGCNIVITITPVINSNILYGAVAIVKSFSDTEKKQHKLRNQLVGKGHRAKYKFEDILGESQAINTSKEIAKRMAKSDSSILIIGESGTGKELFAQAIHNSSKRKDYQFVAVNCAALPESLLESELFGYEEGAFTGARKGGKLGLFELAHMGTLFLDEIGEMPIKLQSRLLRVLQEREVMKIGGDRVINVDVRIIAATNRDLKELVRTGEFRKDLYFRLSVLPLKIPSLKERKKDIPFLIKEMKKEFNADFDLMPQTLEAFINHNWEGNIRELRNYIEYFTNLGEKLVHINHIPFGFEKDNISTTLSEEEKIIVNRLKLSNESDLSKYIFVLEELEKSYYDKVRLGRKSIEKIAEQKGVFLTEQEIRNIFLRLKSFSMVEISKGRGGTKITNFGIKTLEYLQIV